MKSNASDLARLKWAIAFLILMSACGGGAVWSALKLQKSSEKVKAEASAARNDIRAKLARARDEQAELRDKITRFQALKDRGYIGAEQRLDWVEAIARIKTTRRIYKLEYDFAPQRPVDSSILSAGPAAGGFDFLASQMRMQVQFLHEGELLSLINDIRNSVQAIIQLRSCSVERAQTVAGDRNNPAPLKADCTLEWITLKERK
jgi:hypothetical protein